MSAKRATTAAANAPSFAEDAPVPAGYAILLLGAGWLPVRVGAKPGEYIELARVIDERTCQRGPFKTRETALAVIATNPAWRARRDEIERGKVMGGKRQ